MSAGEHFARVSIETAQDLRDWLAENHTRKDSVWLVVPKGGRGPGYDAIVDELIAVGWVDSLPRKLDETHSMLLASPRKPKSNWSAVNKARVARLMTQGRMQPSGLALVEAARQSGTWTALDAVETLEPPADLSSALMADPQAKSCFEAFPRSSRRGILEWIANAKTQETRAKRIAETIRLAHDNLKANHPAGRNAGPKPKE